MIRRYRATLIVAATLLLRSPVGAAEEGMLGVLTPAQEMGLEPRIAGQLTAVHVRIGDVVSAGDLIAELDGEPFEQDLAAANARLDVARAELEASRTQVEIATEMLTRRRMLVEQQAVSREAVSEAEQTLALAQAQVNQAQASVQQQTAVVEQSRSQLRNTRILAPFDSTIAERYSNPGVTAAPGRPIVRLISSGSFRARFAAPVERAAELLPGRSLRIQVPSFDVELGGSINQIGSEVDPASGMIICEAVVDTVEDWDGPPLAGQTIRVWLLPQE